MNAYRVALAAAMAGMTLASPMPQGLDLEALAVLPPPPTYTIATGLAAQTVTVDTASLVASVVSAISEVPLSTTGAAIKAKRQATASVCSGGNAQPTGSGPVTTPDTAAAFLANPAYGQAALAASTPPGYTQVFKNLNASSSDYGYLGYTTLSSYSTSQCAADCSAINDCWSFNIYFERDPSVDPGTGTNCDNPPSTTQIKCVFWGAPISTTTATNSGQWRDQFQVVIAGSNGYVNYNVPAPAGYTKPTYLANEAIQAPLDCNNDNTYMGMRIFQSGPFDPTLCSAACSAASVFDTQQGIPTKAAPQLCTFFNTYMLYKNGQPQGQYCSLYNETWAPSYATNNGQYDQQGNHYTVGFSYSSSNATNPGTCTKAVDPLNGATGCSAGDAMTSCNNINPLTSSSNCICQQTASGQGVVFDESKVGTLSALYLDGLANDSS